MEGRDDEVGGYGRDCEWMSLAGRDTEENCMLTGRDDEWVGR